MDYAYEDDDTKVDMHELFSDPAYREYDRLLRGPYIAALMSRAQARKSGSAKARADVGASTLSDEVRAAFEESQANLAWTTEAKIAAGSKRKTRESYEDDEREPIVERALDAPIPEPGMGDTARADDDFELVSDADFAPAERNVDEDFEIAADAIID